MRLRVKPAMTTGLQPLSGAVADMGREADHNLYIVFPLRLWFLFWQRQGKNSIEKSGLICFVRFCVLLLLCVKDFSFSLVYFCIVLSKTIGL